MSGIRAGLFGFFALVLAVVSAPSFAGPIEDMKPGTWYRVPNSAMRNVMPSPSPDGDPANIVKAWSGGTFDTKRNRFILWGGGHSDYAGNEIYAFSLDSLTWTRLTNPSTNTGGDEGTGTYPDGNPRSGHTYNTLVYADSSDKLYIMGLSAVWNNGGTPGNFFQFDFGASKWSQFTRAPNPGDSKGGIAAYDSATGKVWYRSGTTSGISSFNTSTNTWTSYGEDNRYLELYCTPAIDPGRRLMVCVGGYAGRQIFVWNLDNPSAGPTVPNTTGPRDIENDGASGFTFDTTSRKFVGWNGGTSVYTLDPTNWSWTQVAASSSNTVTPTAPTPNGTFGRFRYIPAKNAFMVVNGVDQDVYIYKLSSGSGTSTPTSPSVTLSASPSSISTNGNSMLTWTSTNATACVASGAWSGTEPLSGTKAVGPLSSTTSYTITCTGSGGTTDAATTTVTVASAPPPPAPTLTLSASPLSIAAGGTSTLSWSSTNATSCTASGGWSGTKATSGSAATAALSTSTSYTLACTGSGGSVQKSVTVSVQSASGGGASAPTLTLSANPMTIPAHSTSTLTWSSGNATACSASGSWTGNKSLSGTQIAGPFSSTSTFTLTCTGTGGSTQKSVTVTVDSSTPTDPPTDPPSTDPPTAPSGTITSVRIASRSSSAQSSVPVTFGEVFRPGDVPAGKVVKAALADGTPVALQVDAKATHPDGSLRHAVMSMRVPTLAAGGTAQVNLGIGSGALTGSAVTLSELLATSFDAEIGLTLNGTRYSASARNLLQAGGSSVKQWLSGPVASEWIVSAPVRTSSGTAHPHLTAYFHVRAYRSANGGVDRVRVDNVVENGWTLVSNPSTFSYAGEIKVGGTSVYSRSITHYAHTRWHKQFWWGATPQAAVELDTQYLQDTRAVPAYASTVKPTDSFLSGLLQDATPMSNGDLTQHFPDTGAQIQIGPLPRWAATYITSHADPRAYRNLLANDDSAGSYSIHYRDEKTGYPVSIADHPDLSLQDDGAFPAVSGAGNPNEADDAHQPSIGYLSYLVTGDYYYLEETQFWTSYNHILSNASYRKGVQGVFGIQVRAQAWMLRNLAQAAYATPDSHRMKAHLVASVGYNIANYEANYSKNSSANKLGAVESYDGYKNFAPWMDDFLSWSIAYVSELGFSAGTMRDWKLKFPVGRMGTTDYCYLKASAYHLTTGTSDANWYPTFAALYQANFGSIGSCAEGGAMEGYPDFAAGYPSNLRPALAVAVEFNIPGAADAWRRLTTSKPQPDYNDYQNWAIVPHGSGSTTTPPTNPAPTLTFTSSASSVASGASVSLTWSGTGVTSCTASGGWSGSKATAGTQVVGPLSASTSFTLACSGSGGSVSKSVSVSVTGGGTTPPPPPAPTVTLSASPTAIASGGSTKVTWSSTNATSCTASGGWTGTKATSGSQTFSALKATTTYTLACANSTGSAQKSVTVSVSSTPPPPPPTPTLSFTGNPTTVASGGSSTLTWTSTNATSCTASGAWTGTKTVSGSSTVGPLTSAKTYTLACTGAGGSISKSVTVSIGSTTQAGSLRGAVDSSLVDPMGQNRVYVFAGSVTPDDYDGTGDPLFSVPVDQDSNACSFSYKLPSLPAGTYTVAFTNQGAKDVKGQNDTLTFRGTSTVTIGTTAVVKNFVPSTILRVGSGKQYSTIRAAAAAASDGAVIEVDAGTYNDDVVVWRQNNLTVRGVGSSRAYVKGTKIIPFESGNDLANGKGLFDVRGNNVRIENFEFSGARVPDENGVGIRGEGSNLTVCNNYFHDNEEGILADIYGTMIVEYSIFTRNGIGDGHTHNIYVNDGGSSAGSTFIFRYNDSNHANIGHLVKSRAKVNYILFNRLMDEQDGTSSYNIDLPNGGTAYIIGNTMQQGPETDNWAMVAWGAEGLSSGRTHALYVVNNTLVNDRGSGVFVDVANGIGTYKAFNNLFVGSGTMFSGVQPTSGANLSSSSPGFVNRAEFDYHLLSTSPARDKGTNPGTAGSVSLQPAWQYLDPAGRDPRPTNGALDVGAFEYVP